MNCSVCGSMFPDGQAACPNCGTPVQPMNQPMGQPMQPMGQPMGQPMQPMGGYQQPMGQPMQPMGGYQQPMGQPMGQPMQPMGQPMGQPMQPMGGYQQPMGQPMGGYQQPMGGGANFNGFINSLKADIMKMIGVIGALLIFLAPFFNWISLKYKYDGDTEKGSANMFQIAGDGEYGMEEGIFYLLAILMLVVGVALIIWDLADFVPSLGGIKAKLVSIPYIELILVGVALIVTIVALCNGTVNDYIDIGKSGIELIEAFGGDVKGHSNHGLGPVVAFIGIAAAAAPRVCKMLNINIGRR